MKKLWGFFKGLKIEEKVIEKHKYKLQKVINWSKVEKDIKEIIKKNTHHSILHYTHGVKPAPLCFYTEEEYNNFINDLLEYIKKLKRR